MSTKLHIPKTPEALPSTIKESLELCWTTWLVFLFVPFVVLPFAAHLSPGFSGRSPRPDLAEIWFRGLSAALVLGLAGSLIVRWSLFKRLWQPHYVPPRRYYIAMFVPWAIVGAVGLVAELVCIETGTFFPNIALAVFALFIFLTLWPTGKPMQPRSSQVPYENMHH